MIKVGVRSTVNATTMGENISGAEEELLEARELAMAFHRGGGGVSICNK